VKLDSKKFPAIAALLTAGDNETKAFKNIKTLLNDFFALGGKVSPDQMGVLNQISEIVDHYSQGERDEYGEKVEKMLKELVEDAKRMAPTTNEGDEKEYIEMNLKDAMKKYGMTDSGFDWLYLQLKEALKDAGLDTANL
jgi:hypothetical protein